MDDPVCHVVAADHVSQPLSGSRTADSFFSFFMPSGSKSASLRMVTQRRTFCMHAFVYSPACLPVIYIFTAYYSLIFVLACIPPPHHIQLFFPHISCPNTAASIVSSCAGPPIPRLSPLHTPNGPALLSPAMFRPSSRYTYSCPLPVPSQVCMQLPKASLLSALFAFCIVSPMACLCPWIQIVYNV